jgi:hypothetical protein
VAPSLALAVDVEDQASHPERKWERLIDIEDSWEGNAHASPAGLEVSRERLSARRLVAWAAIGCAGILLCILVYGKLAQPFTAKPSPLERESAPLGRTASNALPQPPALDGGASDSTGGSKSELSVATTGTTPVPPAQARPSDRFAPKDGEPTKIDPSKPIPATHHPTASTQPVVPAKEKREDAKQAATGLAIAAPAVAAPSTSRGRRRAQKGRPQNILPTALKRLPDQVIPWPGAHVLTMAFSPDGKQLLVGSDGDPFLCQFRVDWKAPVPKSDRVSRWLAGHKSWVEHLVLSADGRRALTASNDKTMRLWDLEKGELIHTFGPFPEAVNRVALSPDGNRAAAVVGNVLSLWDAERASEHVEISAHAAPILSVTFSPDGRNILTSGADGAARLWRPGKTLSLLRAFGGHTGPVYCAAFCPDGLRVLGLGALDQYQALLLWSVKTGEVVCPPMAASFRTPPPPDPQEGWLVIPPGGHQALTTHRLEQTLILWDLDFGRILDRVELGRPLNKAVIAPDGTHVACGTFRGAIEMFELTTE